MQELNIDDLRSQQRENDESKMQSALRRERMKAKNQKTVSSVLGDLPSQSAGSEQPQGEQANDEKNSEQSASTQQQGGESQEGEEKKIPFWQINKRKQTIKKLKELDKKLKKLEKLTAKYRLTTFIFLGILAAFVDMATLPINLCWATIVLIPVAFVLMALQQMVYLFILLKTYKIKTDQQGKEGFAPKIIAFIIKMIPGISALPATVALVAKAHNSAKTQFKKHEDEMKGIEKEMKKLIKQLG